MAQPKLNPEVLRRSIACVVRALSAVAAESRLLSATIRGTCKLSRKKNGRADPSFGIDSYDDARYVSIYGLTCCNGFKRHSVLLVVVHGLYSWVEKEARISP